MAEDDMNLPTFDNPPLVEVAISVEFPAPRGLSDGHLGAFWSKVREELPQVTSREPIAASPNEFARESWQGGISVHVAFNVAGSRLQMTSEDGQWMWQVQSDRLVVNWRKRSAEYPRYSSALARFEEAWSAWCRYLASEGFEIPEPHLWNLTYVNHIAGGKDGLWETPTDWPKVFPGLWAGGFASLSGLRLKQLRSEWTWHHDEPPAKLHVAAHPRGSREDSQLLTLKLTARGPVDGDDDEVGTESSTENRIRSTIRRVEPGLNLGHELIVKTFDSMLSNRAREYWNRYEDG